MRVTTRMNGDARMSSANRIISAIKMKSIAKLSAHNFSLISELVKNALASVR